VEWALAGAAAGPQAWRAAGVRQPREHPGIRFVFPVCRVLRMRRDALPRLGAWNRKAITCPCRHTAHRPEPSQCGNATVRTVATPQRDGQEGRRAAGGRAPRPRTSMNRGASADVRTCGTPPAEAVSAWFPRGLPAPGKPRPPGEPSPQNAGPDSSGTTWHTATEPVQDPAPPYPHAPGTRTRREGSSRPRLRRHDSPARQPGRSLQQSHTPCHVRVHVVQGRELGHQPSRLDRDQVSDLPVHSRTTHLRPTHLRCVVLTSTRPGARHAFL